MFNRNGDVLMINNETKWLVRALVTLAKTKLAEANLAAEDGAWPSGQKWNELVHTSQHIFMHSAREEAGIPHEEYRKMIDSVMQSPDDAQELDAIWKELEKP